MIGINIFCQNIDKKFISGEWVVVKIEKALKNSVFEDVVKGFKTSTFSFKSDESFSIVTKNNSHFSSMMNRIFKDSKWKIGLLNKVLIGGKRDEYSKMLIDIVIKNNEVFFDISDKDSFSLVLKVKKIEE